jgi:hypothetical protein
MYNTKSAFLITLLQGRNGLALDTSELHLLLELVDVANSGEEMRLSTAVAIKGGKPFVPLFLGRFRFLEIANDREFNAGKEAIVDDLVITPAVRGSRDVVGGLLLQPSALFQVKARTLDVVEFKGIFFKDATYPGSLHPKQGSKQNVKGTARNTNQGRRVVGGVGCMHEIRKEWMSQPAGQVMFTRSKEDIW